TIGADQEVIRASANHDALSAVAGKILQSDGGGLVAAAEKVGGVHASVIERRVQRAGAGQANDGEVGWILHTGRVPADNHDLAVILDDHIISRVAEIRVVDVNAPGPHKVPIGVELDDSEIAVEPAVYRIVGLADDVNVSCCVS